MVDRPEDRKGWRKLATSTSMFILHGWLMNGVLYGYRPRVTRRKKVPRDRAVPVYGWNTRSRRGGQSMKVLQCESKRDRQWRYQWSVKQHVIVTFTCPVRTFSSRWFAGSGPKHGSVFDSTKHWRKPSLLRPRAAGASINNQEQSHRHNSVLCTTA